MPQSKSAAKQKEEHTAAPFLMGRSVAKTFKGLGVFHGRVADFDATTGFRVEYEDGDVEDVAENELVRT
jgi:hypothetical protein